VDAYRIVSCRGLHVFKTIGLQMAVSLSALRTGPTLLPTNIFWYSFLLEAESTSGIRKLKKKINDLIGNRTRDLPACSIVLQRTTLLRASSSVDNNNNNNKCIVICIIVICMYNNNICKLEHAVAKVVGLRPNEENYFNLPNPSGLTRPWGSLSL
jgi:hypothetical protein